MNVKRLIAPLLASATTLASLPAQAQSSVTIYGVLDTFVTQADKVAASPAGALTLQGKTGSQLALTSGVVAGSRLGFRGQEDLGGGYAAIFNLEAGLNVDSGSFAQGGIPFGRRSIVGLSAPWGTLTIGRQREYSADVFAIHTAAVDFGLLVANVHANQLDRSQGGVRINNSIRYDSPNLSGFVVSLVYGLGEEAGSVSPGSATNVSVAYASGPWNVGGAYSQVRFGTTPAATSLGGATGTPGQVALRNWMVGGRYAQGPAVVFASFARLQQPTAKAATTSFTLAPTFVSTGGAYLPGGPNNDQTDIIDVGGRYNVAGPWSVISSFQLEKATFVGAQSGKTRQFNFGIDYSFSKRTNAYALAARQTTSNMYSTGILGAPGRDNAQTVLAAGIKHNF